MDLKIKVLFILILVTPGVIFSALPDPKSNPQYCGGCHQRIFKEWSGSRMAKTVNNQKVYQFYTGEHGTGGFDGLGFKPMKKGELGDCADCHFPMTSLAESKKGNEVDLGIVMKSKTDYGISCIFCHSVKDVTIKQDPKGRYHTRIGDTVTLGDKIRVMDPCMMPNHLFIKPGIVNFIKNQNFAVAAI